MTLLSTTATMNVETSSQTNPYHRHAQDPRLPAERHNCSDCGIESSIDGGLPVDRYQLRVKGYEDVPLFLCLGDLASRRALGQDVRRVEAFI